MRRRIKLLALLLIVSVWTTPAAAEFATPGSETAICDSLADYFLGAEDYPEAIRLHLEVLRRDPNSALAHYHLGFAYGMVGQTGKEIQEYERAVALGLRIFDLLLNLGLARLERGDFVGATEALQTASSLADRPEVHFNLGIVYERRRMLREAEIEVHRALTQSPNDPDYLNMLAVVAADKGNVAEARDIWLTILFHHPQYPRAAANLRILHALQSETARSTLSTAQVPKNLASSKTAR
jgi:tetratricopeptide (TPR) repeat protein